MDIKTLTQQLRSQAVMDRDNNIGLGFFVSATGSVESVHMPGEDRLYVKYDFTYGSNWDVIQGVDKGISQIGTRSDGDYSNIVWNFPIEILFRGINAHGWPRFVVSVFGIDAFGRDIARGYGSIHIPTTTGTYVRKVRLFRPTPSSSLQKFISWIRGTQPEFFDSRFVAKSEDRDLTRVESVGYVTIKINVVTRGMAHEGYEDGKPVSNEAITMASESLNKAPDSPNKLSETANTFASAAFSLTERSRNPLQSRA